jgi:predicted DsbA family dithiol-disulfide isomerase
MQIDIWSDVVCPFCYIGKRKFEAALEQFLHSDEVSVTWHSFQLRPDAAPKPGQSVHESLAEAKGISVEQAKQMGEHVAGIAREVGLTFDFDKAVPANTLNAHRLTHLTAKYNRQNEVEEELFKAYFTDGRNINDLSVLAQIGAEAGLEKTEVEKALAGDEYLYEVSQDLQEARNLGISGVPFFVINRKYAVSGAQPSEVFLQALNEVWQKEQTAAAK